MTESAEDSRPAPDDRTGDDGSAGFRDSTSLTKWIRGLLPVFIAAQLISMWIHAEGALHRVDQEVPNALRGTWIVVWVVTAVLLLLWIHRANHNARQLGAADMDFTPMRAVGWYFVPVAWFWKPYEVMKEIWRASVDPSDWRGASVSRLLRYWWVLWIVWFWCWEIVVGAGVLNEGGSEPLAMTLLAAYFVLVVALCLVLRAIIGEVHRLQLEHHRRQTAGSNG